MCRRPTGRPRFDRRSRASYRAWPPWDPQMLADAEFVCGAEKGGEHALALRRLPGRGDRDAPARSTRGSGGSLPRRAHARGRTSRVLPRQDSLPRLPRVRSRRDRRPGGGSGSPQRGGGTVGRTSELGHTLSGGCRAHRAGDGAHPGRRLRPGQRSSLRHAHVPAPLPRRALAERRREPPVGQHQPRARRPPCRAGARRHQPSRTTRIPRSGHAAATARRAGQTDRAPSPIST